MLGSRLAVLQAIGYHSQCKRLYRSHGLGTRLPVRQPDEIGPVMLAKIARHTGLTPDDL